MKKIGIDMSHYNKVSGYGIVAKNIIDNLLSYKNFEFYLFSNEEIKLPENIKQERVHIIVNNGMNYTYYRMWYQAKLLKKYGIDVFFTCDQIVPLKKVCTYVSTIHDIFGWLTLSGLKSYRLFGFGKNRKHFFYYLFGLDKIFANKSDHIISPSEFTKNDIIKYFKILPRKIIVAYWGIDHISLLNNIKKDDYILFPLCTIFHDEFIFRLGEKLLDLGIVKKIIYWKPLDFLGKMAYIPKNSNIEIIQKKISDQEKIELISKAKISIYVSQFEGFGFVPLECLKLGTPVIYNDVGSLGEIIGESSIGIKHLNINKYVQIISDIYGNNKKENILIKKGFERSKLYVWQNTVKIIFDVLIDN